PWGQTRSWTSSLGGTAGPGGRGTSAAQLPYLVAANGTNTIAAVLASGAALYFDYSGGSYVARYFAKETLTTNSTDFILTDTTGAQTNFWNFASTVAANKRGLFKSYTDQDGNTTSVTSWTSDNQPGEVQRSSTVGSTTITESYLFSYITSGNNTGLVSSVTLRRKINTGSWTTVRKVEYTYYDGSESYGNLGDLKLVQIKDASGNVLDTNYYRYYTPGESNGYPGGLKYALGAEAYARAQAALTNAQTATNANLAPYADHYFQYDSSQRVTRHDVAGAGSSGGTGLGTYSYSFTTSTNSDGYNNWKYKTVETLPSGLQNI